MNRSILLGALCTILIVGCSDPYAGRKTVTGSVTLEGQPLSDAMIRFEPLEGQDTSSGAVVDDDGQYRMEGQAGLKPGKYRVRITAGDGVTPTNEEPTEGEAAAPGGSTNIVSVDRVPPDYNERSQQEVEVTADGENKFDFAIPKAREIRKRRR